MEEARKCIWMHFNASKIFDYHQQKLSRQKVFLSNLDCALPVQHILSQLSCAIYAFLHFLTWSLEASSAVSIRRIEKKRVVAVISSSLLISLPSFISLALVNAQEKFIKSWGLGNEISILAPTAGSFGYHSNFFSRKFFRFYLFNIAFNI